MLSTPPASPDGFISISARSGSYGSLMDATEASANHAPGKLAPVDAKTVDNDSPDEISEFAKDSLAPLRSTSSARSILKTTSSGELLDPQDSGKIKRAVSWHDFEGNNLHTVREFTPCEHDDAELLFNPGEPKQCCVIC